MNSFEFTQGISAADIGRFLACPSDTPIVVWSLQRLGAVECLEAHGRLTGDPKYMFATPKPGKKLAYEWIRQVMSERLDNYNKEWPIWCSLTRPVTPTDKPDDKLLRMEIAKSRMLVSFYEGWVKLLGVMQHLEMHGGQWPDQWILYIDCSFQATFLLRGAGLAPHDRNDDGGVG